MFQFSSLKCLYHSQLLLELGMLCPGTLSVLLHFQASQTPLRWQHDLDGACSCINLWGTDQEGLEPSVCAGTGSFHSRIPPSNPGGCACLAAGVPEYPGGAAVPDPDYGPDLRNLRGRATFCVSLYILLLIHLFPCIQKSQTLAAVSWVGMGGCRAAQRRCPPNSQWAGEELCRTEMLCFPGQGGVQVKVVGTETQRHFPSILRVLWFTEYFATASSSQHTARDLWESAKRDLSSKVLTFIKD